MDRKNKGDLGESMAVDFLKKKGYRILETNYRCRWGEIDIVACQRDCLVFIEVRTRSNLDFGLPEESLSERKIEHLEKAAHFYRQTHDKLPDSWCIDFVAVEMDAAGSPRRIEVFENALEER
ncbi:MAG: YraN family protein [Dehalococcoidales bacterium]|nr:YraN family protein [Dehalococcoidales bacterium]